MCSSPAHVVSDGRAPPSPGWTMPRGVHVPPLGAHPFTGERLGVVSTLGFREQRADRPGSAPASSSSRLHTRWVDAQKWDPWGASALSSDCLRKLHVVFCSGDTSSRSHQHCVRGPRALLKIDPTTPFPASSSCGFSMEIRMC